MSVSGRVEGHSGHFSLATKCDRTRVHPAVQTKTSPLQRCCSVAYVSAKCACVEAGNRQPARERSDRACPSERARKRVLQPVLCSAQERWWSASDSGLETRQPSPSQASVQNDNSKTDPGTSASRGLVCIRGSEGCVLSCSDSQAPPKVSAIRFRGFSVPICRTPVRTGISTAHILEVRGRGAFPSQSERYAHSELSGRLVNFSPLTGGAIRSYANAASSLDIPGATREHAEKQAHSESVNNVSGGMFRLSGDARPPLSRADGVHLFSSTSAQAGSVCSTEGVSEAFGSHGVSLGGLPPGSSAHATATVLAEGSCSMESMVLGSSASPGYTQLPQCPEPMARPKHVQSGSSPGAGYETHSRYDGCVVLGMGCSVRGHAGIRPLDTVTEKMAYKLLGADGGVSSSPYFPVETGEETCPDSHRQHVRGIVHKSPGRSPLRNSFQTGCESPTVGRSASTLCQGSAYPRSSELRSGHAFEGGSSARRMEASSRLSAVNLGALWDGGSGFIRDEQERALPAVFLADPFPHGERRSDGAMAERSALRVSSGEDFAPGAVQNQRGDGDGDPRRSVLAESTVVSGPKRIVNGTAVADSPQERPVVPSERHDISPQLAAVESSCLASSGVLNALPQRVLDTISECRAPSTRRLYALKWGVFVKWCSSNNIDPMSCPVSDILCFLQHSLDSGGLPSTLKVYVAAIASFRSPVDGQSIGRHMLVVRFLRGARRLFPPRSPSVPPWDLALVLKALSFPPFEPLDAASLRELTLKTVLLLALASAKRIGDLQALSVGADFIRFGTGDCNVTLRPKSGYVPKSMSTPFRAQVISLPALFSESSDSQNANAPRAVCPVRVLRAYIDRTAGFRQSEQLFVCYGGGTKGRAVSKQRLSHWVVDAITLAYESQGQNCPFGIRAHSTRAIASSWAWSRGTSIQDICCAAGWSSQNTFARFYRLDVSSLSSQVLSMPSPDGRRRRRRSVRH
ncbi:TBC1 domain family member 20 isoform X1 [Triplophysa dalaica]|uniref:TBC1 domain family member 20 isoform X1 n=1 Tax=Triplophysa dalaica TaxID=1582913 RepID=UPI0024DFAD28|nr:TBC1 domain family member 20 isoform X1 [Triplophysa dalaica]